MEEETKKEPCVLHFTRVRGKGEPEFYEPNTDIRKVFPATADIAIRYLQDVFKDQPDMVKDLDYLFRCFKIFQIRVIEDNAPVAQQLSDYIAAINKVNPSVLLLWRETQFRLQAAVYALFCRRDSRTDSDSLHALLEAAKLALYKDTLTAETFKAVEKELREAEVTLKDKANVITKGLVICQETNEVIDSVKAVASAFINCSGSQDWDSLADACDAEFSTQSRNLTDEQAVCLALAYPSYEHNDLTVEVTKDNG